MTVTIVTAANAAFGRTLAQFLLSVRRRGLHRQHRILAYDLGLTPEQRQDLSARFPWCEIVRFCFEDYPPHVAVEAKTFAWKPLIIAEVAERFGGTVFWLDSATLFHGDLSEPLEVLARHQVYTLEGQSNVDQCCEPAVRDYLRIEAEFLHRQVRIGGVLGLETAAPAARKLIATWRDLALDPRAFAAERIGHNADQTVLSVVLFRMEKAGDLVLNPGDIDISSFRPVRWLSSRNKVLGGQPLWADPLVRLGYRAYKVGDRINLRWQDFCTRRLMGLHRWPKEHFQVFVMRPGDKAPTPVRAPALSYYADPFLMRRDGRLWLFVEEFEYLEQCGRLVAMELDDALRPGPVHPVLPLREHASFPYLFQIGERLMMVPETCALGALDLYECVGFPDKWRRVRRFFHDVDPVDTKVFHRGGKWWLVTCMSAGGEGARTLHVFSTDDLEAGALTAHPVNGERHFADGSHGYGRGAGNLFLDADGPMRVIQKNTDYYGQAAEVRRIAPLTPEAYAETPVGCGHPLADLVALVSPHHVAMCEGAVTFDVRDRLGFASGLPGIGPRLAPIDPVAKRFLAGDPSVTAAVADAVSRLETLGVRAAPGLPHASVQPCDG